MQCRSCLVSFISTSQYPLTLIFPLPLLRVWCTMLNISKLTWSTTTLLNVIMCFNAYLCTFYIKYATIYIHIWSMSKRCPGTPLGNERQFSSRYLSCTYLENKCLKNRNWIVFLSILLDTSDDNEAFGSVLMGSKPSPKRLLTKIWKKT